MIVVLRHASLLLVTACDFSSGTAKSKDAGAIDAAISDTPAADAPIDAMTMSPCHQKWLAGTVQLGAPVQLTQLADPGEDRDPYLAPDGLALFFTSPRTPSLNLDVWTATRATKNDAFGAPALRADLNSPDTESRISMTGDGLTVVVSSSRPGSQNLDFWSGTRPTTADPFGTLTRDAFAAVNTGGQQLDEELSADGKTLYFAQLESPQQILFATRPTPTGSFGNALPVPIVNSGLGDADPSLSFDERVIVFGSGRPGFGGGDLWYARRATTAVTFGVPVLVPAVNTMANEGDPALSSDGCELYFATDRLGGDWEIFVAKVQ